MLKISLVKAILFTFAWTFAIFPATESSKPLSTGTVGLLLSLATSEGEVKNLWDRVVRETFKSEADIGTSSRQKRNVKDAKPGELYLPEDYNSLEIPKTKGGGPLPVALYLNLRSIATINEAEEEMVIEFDATVEWHDSGLSTEHATNDTDTTPRTLEPGFIKKIWRPDIFIENLIEATQPILVHKPIRFKYSSTGHMIFNSRVKIRVDCNFYFKYYPADTQTCTIIFRSYAFNSTEFEFKWRRPTGVFLQYPEDDNYDIAVNDVQRVRFRTFADGDRTSNETFDALQFTIKARRRLSYHIIQTYLPSQLYIAITWLCFMVPKNLVEGRIAIVMTTLLTLTSMFSSVRESTPAVSYTKAIDIWMVACITSVFMVLLECAALLWTETEKQLKEEREHLREEEEASTMTNDSTAARLARHMLRKESLPVLKDAKTMPDPTQPRRSLREMIRKVVLQATTGIIGFIEEHSFILVLSVYVLLNGLYWSWLLNNSGYFDWAIDATHNALADDNVDAEVLADMYAN